MLNLKLSLILSILSVSISAVSFAENTVTNATKPSVCILSYDTEFKRKLTDALVKDLAAKDILVTTDSISNIGKYGIDRFDAVILLANIEKFGPLPIAPEYIISNNYSPKIVYVSTYKLFAIPYGSILDKKKIDAVTSASDVSSGKAVEETKNKIMAKTLKILDKN